LREVNMCMVPVLIWAFLALFLITKERFDREAAA
jgi:hypothetical protein